MKNTLIYSALILFIASNFAFSQNISSGPQALWEMTKADRFAEETEIKTALQDLSFQLLELELDAGELERIYKVRTPFFEVVEIDLMEGLDLRGLAQECEYDQTFDLMEELELMHLSMVDLEVEMSDLDEELGSLSAYNNLDTAGNPKVDPEVLRMELDPGLVSRYQSLGQSARGLFAGQIVNELEAMAMHVLALEARVIVLKAALAQRKGFGGLATTESE